MRSTFGLLFLTLSIFGCAASEPAQCIKGQYNLCRCATGQAGTQLCVDGFSVSDCECLPSTASTPGPTPDSPSNPTKPQPLDPNKRWVFVTVATYLANFGWYGGSALCTTAAKNAGLDRGNRWTALVKVSPILSGPVPLTDVLTGKGPVSYTHLDVYKRQVYVPDDVRSLTLEAPTGYLAGDLASFYTVNLDTGVLSSVSPTPPGEQQKPLVVATPDGSAAMGAWSPELPQAGNSGGYGKFAFPSADATEATNKWNIVFRHGPLAAGTIVSHRAYLAVGSLENVRVAMKQLYDLWRSGGLP